MPWPDLMCTLVLPEIKASPWHHDAEKNDNKSDVRDREEVGKSLPHHLLAQHTANSHGPILLADVHTGAYTHTHGRANTNMLSDPTEIPPPYRETGLAILLSHCVFCGIADYRCYTPTSFCKSGLSQSKDRPWRGDIA